jgi:hypothetical protein
VADYASSLDLAAFPMALDLRKVLPTREIRRREEFKFWLQRYASAVRTAGDLAESAVRSFS